MNRSRGFAFFEDDCMDVVGIEVIRPAGSGAAPDQNIDGNRADGSAGASQSDCSSSGIFVYDKIRSREFDPSRPRNRAAMQSGHMIADVAIEGCKSATNN